MAPAITRGKALERVALEGVEVGARQRDDDDAQGEGAVGDGQAPERHDEQHDGDPDPRDMQPVADVVPVRQVGERVVDGRDGIGERAVVRLLLLDLERLEETRRRTGAHPGEIGDGAGDGGHDGDDLARPPCPSGLSARSG